MSQATSRQTFSISVSKDASKVPERHGNKVASGEIRIILAAVEADIGYKTLERILPTFKQVDKDSKVWQDIKLGHSKASYSVSDALGPYFSDMNMQNARAAPGFSVYFDAATNKMGGLSKHLDIRLTYWDKDKGEVSDCLLAIISLTHETAEILKTVIMEKLSDQGLKLNNILALSRDNPRVNQRLVKEMKEEVKSAGGVLIDLGCDPCHVAHLAFEKGLSELSIDIPTLAISLHGFFKYSTIRRSQFADELMELDLEESTFKRHLNSRWLSLGPAAIRIDKNYDAIKNYFLVTLPGLANGTESCKCEGECRCKENARDAIKTKYYSLIKQEISASACRTVLKIVIFVSEKFTPFLTCLQSSAPLIHTLFKYCVILLLEVTKCLLKESKVPDKSSTLIKLDLSDESMWRKTPQMSPSAKECFKNLSQYTQEKLSKELCQVFMRAGIYLQKNLAPLKSNLVRNLRALDPKQRCELSDNGNSAIIQSAKALSRFSSAEIDSLSLQWDALTQVQVEFGDKDRIDIYYKKVLQELERKHPGENDILAKFLKLALSLAHSNCSVERGFSVTKRTLQNRENMNLASLFGQKVTKDAIHFHGGSANVPIPPSLLAAQNKAHSNYTKRVEAEQKEKREREARLKAAAEASRKRAADREAKAKFEDKKKRLEEEEKRLTESLQADETMLDGMMERAVNTTSRETSKSNMAAASQLRATIKRKQSELSSISAKIRKLMESKIDV